MLHQLAPEDRSLASQSEGIGLKFFCIHFSAPQLDPRNRSLEPFIIDVQSSFQGAAFALISVPVDIRQLS